MQRSTWAIFSGLIAFLTCMPPSPAQEIPVAANGAPVGLTTARQKETSTGNIHEGDHPALQRRNARYRLCASDAIILTFPLTPEFNQTEIGKTKRNIHWKYPRRRPSRIAAAQCPLPPVR